MKISGNTILVTGGGTGIGRGLAEAWHAKGNQVIIAGRDEAVLSKTAGANPGMAYRLLDVTDGDAIIDFTKKVVADFPSLNVVLNNAGIMRFEDLLDGKVDAAEATIATNLLGPIRLTAAMLPHLMAQKDAVVMTVTSGLAFVPRAIAPTYCATKAAIHSYSQTLRVKLRGTSVQVIELVPPFVQTELMGPDHATDPRAMPLADFLKEVMTLLETKPDADEILVERVMFQRMAEREGRYDTAFQTLNP